MVRVAEVGLMALDPGDERWNGRGPGRRRGACRLRDRSSRPSPHGRRDRTRRRVLQALVFARHRISGAYWWAIANPPAWALGWLVTSYVITRNVDERFPNFGLSGALVFALLTWLLLAFLLGRTAPEVPRAAATAAR
jgi:hypothetical protein